MNVVAGLIGYSAFVLWLLAVADPGYYYDNDLERWTGYILFPRIEL